MPTPKEILRRQVHRLRVAVAKSRARAEAKKIPVVKVTPEVLKAELKAPAVVKPVIEPKKVVAPKVEAPKPAASPEKIVGFSPSLPANGDSKWILAPREAHAMTQDEMMDKYNFKELRKIGKQYAVKGSSKAEFAYDIKAAAKKLSR